MTKLILFKNLISANIKRIFRYIPAMLLSVFLLLGICSFAMLSISKNLYEDETFSRISIAYYLPEDDDIGYNSLGLGMLENLESMQTLANLYKVATVDEGYELLASGEVLFYIIVPDMFFTGIMTGTNPQLEIVVRDFSTMASFVANQLFLSYGRYLGVAQAGIYSAIDVGKLYSITDEELEGVIDVTNLTYLDRALNSDSYSNIISAENAGSFTLTEHYLAVATMLTLFFIAFTLTPCLLGTGNGIKSKLSTYGINSLHLFVSNFICSVIALFIAYIPCYLGISIYNKHFNISGSLYALFGISIIALIISAVSILCNKNFTANLAIYVTALLLCYIGGGLLPDSFLPNAVQRISEFLPGEYIIRFFEKALFL